MGNRGGGDKKKSINRARVWVLFRSHLPNWKYLTKKQKQKNQTL